MNKSVYSVAQINGYIKGLIGEDFLLRNVSVRGELSGVKYASQGYVFFSLKDESGVLPCMVGSWDVKNLTFRLEDGQSVVVTGKIDVAQKYGQYRMMVKAVEREGVGKLYEQYLRLREKLRAQGLFDPQYKQEIPPYVRTVGVATSATGAVINDIKRVAWERNPYVKIVLAPCAVQGEGAAAQICRAIERLDSLGLDVIIVGRGGGSLEDLWCFNEESVAWAIFNCQTPVISAVGHESDFTIADEVADRRASTPSNAAEIAVFEAEALEGRLAAFRDLLRGGLLRRTAASQGRLLRMEKRLERVRPAAKVQLLRQRQQHDAQRLSLLMRQRAAGKREALGLLEARLKQKDPAVRAQLLLQRLLHDRQTLSSVMRRKAAGERERFKLLMARLEGRSPVRRLSGGYAFVEKGSVPVKSAAVLAAGDVITVRFSDGAADASVERVRKNEG
ncbi:MAG: exodeoxyribonuclease VII large subunit [Lachnospiraceae bacterium]|nr:exodeoxyribonuclease VII large subunit [Lachnospiraceae bacterium]